jgi:2-hydroxychromene-2-carboxylate isomerase
MRKRCWRAGGDEDRSSLEDAVDQVRDDGRTVKMYSDFKSPYAYLAFDPAMALPERFDVQVRWIPFQLRLKGKGERSVYSEYKVKYSYMDARRWAKPRRLWIRGPLKIYDTTPAAIGGLFAHKHGRRLAYERCQEEAATDHVFGVPFFIFSGEPFWGYDRMPLLEHRLTEAGLGLSARAPAA